MVHWIVAEFVEALTMPENVVTTPAKYTLEGGGTIIVEAEVPRGYGEEQVSFLRRTQEQLPKLGDAIGHILPALREIGQRIQQLEIGPDEIELALGVKFVGEAGVIIARASSEANLVLKIKWQPKPSEGSKPAR